MKIPCFSACLIIFPLHISKGEKLRFLCLRQENKIASTYTNVTLTNKIKMTQQYHLSFPYDQIEWFGGQKLYVYIRWLFWCFTDHFYLLQSLRQWSSQLRLTLTTDEFIDESFTSDDSINVKSPTTKIEQIHFLRPYQPWYGADEQRAQLNWWKVS